MCQKRLSRNKTETIKPMLFALFRGLLVLPFGAMGCGISRGDTWGAWVRASVAADGVVALILSGDWARGVEEFAWVIVTFCGVPTIHILTFDGKSKSLD